VDGKLYCFDAKTGERLWKFNYGRSARGSPVLADGKIYVGEVNSRFHILQPSRKKCKELHEQFFQSHDGVSDVEINGSPAVANGRVYFATSDAFYCIGKKGAKAAPPVFTDPKDVNPDPNAKPRHLQVVPADVEVRPGETVTFRVRAFDEKGEFVRELDAKLSLPPTTLPTGKVVPPLQGQIDGSKLTLAKDRHAQAGLVKAEAAGLVGTARVRVVPRLPYVEDFSKVPDGGVPPGWVNCAGKFVVASLADAKGAPDKVLRKVNDKSNPLFSRGNTYLGLPTMKDYTIQADLMGTKVILRGKEAAGGKDKEQAAPEVKGKESAEGREYMPDMGIVANRYTLMLAGNIQKLRILSWSALPRVDETIAFAWKPGVWYRMKLTVQIQGDKGIIRGKVWPRDQPEPSEWTIETTDPVPDREGSPALYGYITGITDTAPGNEVYYDNVRVTPNKK
jgi:hypothetical protein